MASTLVKMAPMVAVAGLTGYCLMPSLSPPPPSSPPPKDEGLPKIESRLLDPRLEPPLERNPFESRPVVEKPAEGAATPGAVASEPDADPLLPDGLVLGATMVHGRRRAALIGGRIYGEGEALRPEATGADASANERPLTVARIEHDRVWLSAPGRAGRPAQLVALTYASRLGATPAAADGAAPAEPTEPGTPEHLKALANPAEVQALLTVVRGVLGDRMPGTTGSVTSPAARPGRGPRRSRP